LSVDVTYRHTALPPHHPNRYSGTDVTGPWGEIYWPIAQAIDERLARWPVTSGGLTRWRASIAAALGHKARAVSLLQQAYEEGESYFLWTHRAVDLESLRGYPPFEAFVKPKD
jgi:hypothetical protein